MARKAWTWLVLASAACHTRPSAPVATASAPPTWPLCGNGIVDRGELCDPDVRWAERCPAPWGMCWTCGPTCTTWVPSPSQELEHVTPGFYCTQDHWGGSAQRTYDARGDLLSHHETWPSQHSSSSVEFRYDAAGGVIGTDQRFDGSSSSQTRLRNELDVQHRRVRTWDELAPGKQWHFEYATDGPLLRFWGGDTADGVPEVDRRYTYDRDHHLIADVETFRDARWHSATVFAYDTLGRKTDEVMSAARELATPSFDCHTDFIPTGSRRCCTFSEPPSTTCWTSDALGELVSVVSKMPGQPETVERHANAYDPRGLLAGTTVTGGNGDFLWIDRISRDRRGLPLTIARQTAPGGAFAVVDHRTYDCLAPVFAAMPERAFTER